MFEQFLMNRSTGHFFFSPEIVAARELSPSRSEEESSADVDERKFNLKKYYYLRRRNWLTGGRNDDNRKLKKTGRKLPAAFMQLLCDWSSHTGEWSRPIRALQQATAHSHSSDIDFTCESKVFNFN